MPANYVVPLYFAQQLPCVPIGRVQKMTLQVRLLPETSGLENIAVVLYSVEITRAWRFS